MNTLPDIEFSETLIRRFDKLGPRYTSYPTADRFHAEFTQSLYTEYLAQRAKPGSQNPPLSIYVHVLFCESPRYFCACNKIITQDRSRTTEYLRYLAKEMALVTQHLGPDRRTAQLHFGGGTPTFLSPDELRELMAMLRGHFNFLPDAELGIEIDPRTVNVGTMTMLAELGFNRTSFGVQDFDPAVQQSVNRIQPYEMVEKAVTASRKAGFESVNADLIYGLPKQSLESFNRNHLDRVIELAPERIALYNYAHLPNPLQGPAPDCRSRPAQCRVAFANLSDVGVLPARRGLYLHRTGPLFQAGRRAGQGAAGQEPAPQLSGLHHARRL